MEFKNLRYICNAGILNFEYLTKLRDKILINQNKAPANDLLCKYWLSLAKSLTFRATTDRTCTQSAKYFSQRKWKIKMPVLQPNNVSLQRKKLNDWKKNNNVQCVTMKILAFCKKAFPPAATLDSQFTKRWKDKTSFYEHATTALVLFPKKKKK